MGCDGCELWNNTVKSCYAGVLHDRYGGSSSGYAPKFEQVTLFPGRMAEAANWGPPTEKECAEKPWLPKDRRVIFISDMSDALSQAVPFSYLQDEIIKNVTSEKGKRHIWLWLTKRPKRMVDFANTIGEWPENLWPGTSVTNQLTLDQRVIHLLKINAKIRFLSAEPLLEEIDLGGFLSRKSPIEGFPNILGSDWIIVGAESGSNRRVPESDAIESVVRQCVSAQIPIFVKQGSCLKPGMQGNISDEIWSFKQFPKTK